VAEPYSHPMDENIEDDFEEPTFPEGLGQSRAVAEYLGDMIGQLESMARVSGLDLLVYLLSMARVEAEAQARGAPDAPQGKVYKL